jgi:hypothetical protein
MNNFIVVLDTDILICFVNKIEPRKIHKIHKIQAQTKAPIERRNLNKQQSFGIVEHSHGVRTSSPLRKLRTNQVQHSQNPHLGLRLLGLGCHG